LQPTDNTLERYMEKDYIEEKLAKIDMLPTFPHIVGEIERIMRDPKSSASDLAKHMDPSMVGEVLRIANAAYLGTSHFKSITSLEHAIAVVGFEQLSHIILHMPFISMTEEDPGTFDRDLFIRHSIICGVLSKAISLRMHMGDPNEVYLGGIMHDVGAIIIYRHFRKEWQEIDRVMSDSHLSRIEAERKVLSVDHGYIGATLLEMWNTPKPITDVVRFHHQPELATENHENVLMTNLANGLAKIVDLTQDLVSFDDFTKKHRISIGATVAIVNELSPSEEVAFLENIYQLLKETKNYMDSITEGNDDKDSCS
jgi:HD-like signal output (HDOD) protein